jgi:hypothetical protein
MCRIHLILVFFIFSLTACIPQRAYYLSPGNANSEPYHPMRLASDSIPSAVYMNLVYTIGSANQLGTDQVSMGHFSIHRSNHFGIFQAYYGTDISLGAYKVGNFENSHYRNAPEWLQQPLPYDTIYHVPGKGEFVGSYGISGGINIVKKLPRGEWRALGFETSIQKEFGNYLRFRKNLPDSAANIIFRKPITVTMGLYTDCIWQNRHKVIFGFKFSGGMIINSGRDYTKKETDPDFPANNIFPITYFSITYHMTRDRVTGFIQFNFGTYADSFQVGFSYRLGKK